ncbi:MAG: penicillin-binding protein 2 [Chthoniobacterales bacterium]
MRRAIPGLKVYIFAGIILMGLSGLLFKLWYVQIAHGSDYIVKSNGKSQVTVRLPAVRGEILDKNGISLVQNRSSFEVDFYLPAMVQAYRALHKGVVPVVKYRQNVHDMPKEHGEADVQKIVNEAIMPRLEELGIAHDYNSHKLQMHYRNNTLVPYSYIQDLDFETMAKFSENNIGLPGVDVTVKPVRNYVYGAFAAHLLGYVGPEKRTDIEESKKYNFYQPDLQGQVNLELTLDDELKGTPGVKILQRNAKGVIEGEVGMVEPKQGSNVYLTIDARIQFIVEQALRSVGRGAAVVVDPNNGNILAMASVPSYDPNTFIPSISTQDWVDINKDETNPMLNRAISAYAPGSTYKLMVALAGLRKGVGSRSFNCGGGVTYGNTFMKCWIAAKGGNHGVLNLPTAIKLSCNGFFYQYGNAAGIDIIDSTGALLGLGSKTGIPLSGEAPGVLPGPEWLTENKPNERWSAGLTANTSIGQGDVLASPLQMAMIGATLANGGICYEPRLVDKVVAQDGTLVSETPIKIRSDMIKDGGLTAEQIEIVRKGMFRVVNEEGGTAGKGRVKGIQVAGKTGTAQFWRGKVKDNHTWFLSFAPYDKPRYVICLLVQGANSGGGVCAPLAAKIYTDIFAMDEGKIPELVALEPAKGNFKFVESIDFGRGVPAATTAADDETAPVDSDARAQESKPDAAPNIRDEADEGGRVKNKKPDKKGLEGFFKNLFGGKKKDNNSNNQQRKPSAR